MMSYLYCGGTESLKTNVPDLLEVRIANVHKINDHISSVDSDNNIVKSLEMD